MRSFLLSLVLLITLPALGQYAETIRTGRPGAAIGPFTVGHHIFQVQSGINLGNTLDQYNSTGAAAVFRYGILEKVELSAVAIYSEIKYDSEGTFQSSKSGLSTAQVGFRINIRDSGGKGPSIGFQSRLKLNILDEDFDQPNLASVHMLILSQNLGSQLGLTGNIGINTNGSDVEGDNPNGVYVLNLNRSLGQKFSVFIENFGSFGTGFNTHFDTGLGFLLNPDFQLDASVGYGKNNGLEDLFFDFGFSWRTKRKNHRSFD